jgi:hypothetical protein
MEVNEGNSLDKFTIKSKYQKVPLAKLFIDVEALYLNAVADVVN